MAHCSTQQVIKNYEEICILATVFQLCNVEMFNMKMPPFADRMALFKID